MADADWTAVRTVVEAELALLEPDLRTSPTRVGEFLDPEFYEFGASGRRWDRDSIIRALADEPADTSDRVVATDIEVTRLGTDLIQVTYLSTSQSRRALRCSLWRRSGDGRWRIFFHQGTPTAS